jgi:hypothetical protein
MTLGYNKTLTNEFFATLGTQSPNQRYAMWPTSFGESNFTAFSLLDITGPTYTLAQPTNAADLPQLDETVLDNDGTLYSLDGSSAPSLYKVTSFGADAAVVVYTFDGSAGGIGRLRMFISPTDATRWLFMESDDAYTIPADQRSYIYNSGTEVMEELSTYDATLPDFLGGVYAQDMFGDIWNFNTTDAGTDILVVRRIVDFGSGSAAPSYNEITLTTDITGGSAFGATHTPSGWVFNSGDTFYLLDTDDFSIITSQAFAYPTIAWLEYLPSGLSSFWVFAAVTDPFNQDTFVEISAADLSTLASHPLEDWIGVGDSSTTVLDQSFFYFPSSSAFYTQYADYEVSDDQWSVIRYLGDEPTPEPVSADVTARAWGFSLDGHEFYVLRANDKTFVFDRLTRQWSHWSNNGLDRWRPVCGINWRGMASTLADGGTDVVCGDEATGVLYRLDPAYGRDDKTDSGDQSFSRIVTGSIPVDGRESIPCNAVQITLGLGNPSQTGAALTLETSDNLGASYISHGTVTIASLDYTQVVEWRALGQIGQPGRLFRITDDGATVRIGRAQIR